MGGGIPGQVHPPQAGTPLGRYTPLGAVHAGEIRATSGRPYWNAFLSELYLIEMTLRHAFSDDFLFKVNNDETVSVICSQIDCLDIQIPQL